MLACIACSKHVEASMEEEEEEEARSPATRESIKSLTHQLKGMAMRFSAGTYRHCRPCTAAGDGPMISYGGIDSMDIMDVSSELSAGSNTHNSVRGSNTSSYYSTPAQSFKETPNDRSRKGTPTNHIASSRHQNDGKNHNKQGKLYNNRDKGSSYDNANAGSKIKPAPGYNENGFKLEVEEEHKETEKDWVAQVEPGVLITFVTLLDGGNDLKRIRFSREMFNKWQAQQWWAENCDKIHELYNVPKLSRMPAGSLPAPSQLEDEGYKSHYSEEEYKKLNAQDQSNISHEIGDEGRIGMRKVGWHRRGASMVEDVLDGQEPSTCASEWEATSEEEHAHHSNLSRCCSWSEQGGGEEWIEEDQPGVYITLASYNGSTKLKRIRFREEFTEVEARLWWEENRIRVYEQYL